MVRNAPSGTGIIAGGAMRAVFEAVGIQDVVSKSLATSNPYNLVKATFDALQRTDSPKMIAVKRGKKISEIISRRNQGTNNSSEKDEDEVVAEKETKENKAS